MDGEAVAKYANYVRRNHELKDERQEAVSKLRKIPVVIIEGDNVFRYSNFFHELANAIGISEHITFATVRDRLIHLIGGDEEEMSSLAKLPIAATLPSFETTATNQDGVVVTIASDGTIKTNDDELRHDVEMWRDRAEDMRMERDVLQAALDARNDTDAIAEYHRTLRRMMGEAKCVHDKLVTQAESHAKLKHECRMYRAMLNDAVKDFSEQRAEYEHAMVGYRERAAALEDSERLRHELEQERDAYKQNYHDIIHGNEINEEWFDKRGFIELPKGADGKHIRIGDTVRWGDGGEPFKVQTIEYYPSTVSISDREQGIYVSACHCNHVDGEPDPATSAFDKYDAGLLTRDELVAALREAS